MSKNPYLGIYQEILGNLSQESLNSIQTNSSNEWIRAFKNPSIQQIIKDNQSSFKTLLDVVDFSSWNDAIKLYDSSLLNSQFQDSFAGINNSKINVFDLKNELTKAIETSGIQKTIKNLGLNANLVNVFDEKLFARLPANLRPFVEDLKQMQENMGIVSRSINNHLANISEVNEQLKVIQKNLKELLPYNYAEYKNIYQALPQESKIRVVPDNSSFQLLIMDDTNVYPLSTYPQVQGIVSLFEEIKDVNEIIDFQNYLYETPMLGMRHRVGQIIYQEMNNLLKSNKSEYFCVLKKNHPLYRTVRWREKRRNSHYLALEMFEAPLGMSGMGRFNPIEINHLYMSSDAETSKKEVNLVRSNRYSTVEARLRKDERFLCIEPDQNAVFTFCLKPAVNDERKIKPEYLIPNYIAQCFIDIVRENELEIIGIRYVSAKNSKAFSYVLFNKNRDVFASMSVRE